MHYLRIYESIGFPQHLIFIRLSRSWPCLSYQAVLTAFQDFSGIIFLCMQSTTGHANVRSGLTTLEPLVELMEGG